MRKGFRPSLEPPSSRRVDVNGRRPLVCLGTSALVVFLLFLIFGISGWNIHQHQFSRNEYVYYAGDQVALHDVSQDLSSVFCDGYQVTLGDQDEAYILPHQAHISQSHIDTSPFSLRHESNRPYSFLQAYLLRGSYIELGACRENGSVPDVLHILLIKGRDEFDSWTKDPPCSDCLFRHVTVIHTPLCEDSKAMSHKPKVDLRVRIARTDLYSLVVHYEPTKGENRDQKDKSVVIVSGIFNRTKFNVEGWKKLCIGPKNCDIDLPWDTFIEVVVELKKMKGRVIENGNVQKYFSTSCHARLSIWLGIFGAIPGLLALLVIVTFSLILCRKSQEANLSRLSKASKKRQRIKTTSDPSVVVVPDGAGLVCGEILNTDTACAQQQKQEDDHSCMAIQDG